MPTPFYQDAAGRSSYTIFPRHAAILARLECGQPVDDAAVAKLPSELQGVAHALADGQFRAQALNGHPAADVIADAMNTARNLHPAQGPLPDDDAPGPGSGAPAGGWPAPEPIRADLSPVSPLTPDMLPGPLRDWLADIAERISCPLDFPAVGAVVALAILVGRRAAIRPKRHDDWTVVPNLWGIVIGTPGVMKTPAVNEAIKPLNRLAADARKRYEAARQDYDKKASVFIARRNVLQKALADAAKADEPVERLQELADAVAALEAPEEPILRRYTTTDATVEKLGELLRDNPHGLGMVRDELNGWLKSFERSGRESDRQFFLEAWNGNGGAFITDRIGRGTILIKSPCVSVLGTIQPGLMGRLVQAQQEAGDDGFLSRFQLAVWPDTGREWLHVDRWPDTLAKTRAYKLFQALDAFDPLAWGADSDASDKFPDADAPPYFRFTPDTQDVFNAWLATLEGELRAGGLSVAMETHLAKYRSLMPSLALLFHLARVADGGPGGAVSLDAVEMARRWCEYLRRHAERIYGSAAQDDLDAAQTLADKIKAGRLPSPFSYRDVYHFGWAGLGESRDVQRAVAVLERFGWVRLVHLPATGGAPKTEVHLNPALPRKSGT